MDRQDLSNAYDELEAARAQQREHTVSAAKSIEPDGLEGTSLSNAPDMREAFDQGSGRDGLGPPAGIGSQQVRDSGADHDMKPPPEIADEPDRDKHQSDMGRDDEAARQANYFDSLAQGIESRDRGQELDQGRGLG